MLIGSYTNPETGSMYSLIGYDFGEAVLLHLSCPITKSMSEIDYGIRVEDEVRPPHWDYLYLSVGAGNISVKQDIIVENGKKYKHEYNKELLANIGIIIRGMKSGSNKNNLKNTDNLYNTGYSPMKIHTYVYNEGEIDLDMGLIRRIDYDGIYGKMHLEDDYSYSEKIYAEKVTEKIKLDLSHFISSSMEDDEDWDFSGESDKIFSLQEIIEKNPDKSYVWLKERKYYIINELEEVESICKKIWQHDGIVAFDTETTGLNVTVKSREGQGDRLVGMVFSIEPGVAYYFPVAHKKIKNICTPGNEQFIIEKYFKPLLEKKDLVCHNGAYDWKVMYNYDICINLVHDTYILFKVTLWGDHTQLNLGLKSLTKLFLGRDSFELSDFVEGKFDSQNVKFWDLEEESVKYYACPDTDNDLELLQYALEHDFLGQYDARKIYQIEVLFSIVIAYQEYYGHHVDTDKIDELVEAIKKDKEESYKAMTDLVGVEFNPKSSKDMQKVCFDILGLPVVDKTDSGNPSTGKDTRKQWLKDVSISEEKKNFVANLNKYLDARTLESNFTNNIGKYATDDGLMFSTVQQFLATGRVSTSDPNYQGYSDTVKKYIEPRNGYYAMDADYSSVEARIMCSMAGCKNMVEKLKDPDADYHRLKASDMFGVPYELVSDKLRKMSKGVNFGILYGLGDPNLGVNLFGSKTPENTRKAKHQKELYFKGMEELRSFIDISKAQGTTNNFSTTYFKRRRYFDPRKNRKDTIERQSCNARIQGTAADIYKLAMVRLFMQIRNRGWLGKVLISGFVHDECYLEVSKSINPAVMLKVLREAMMLSIEGWCPLYTGMGFGKTWYEAKHTEIPVQVQESIANEYGDIGFPWWNGDTDYLCNWVVNEIECYKRDRVIDYLKNEDNWNKPFKPTENELCHSLLKDLKDGTMIDGESHTDANPQDDMLENLKEFCRIFNCLYLYEQANVQIPHHVEQQNENDTVEEVTEEEEDMHESLLLRVKMMGVHSIVEDGKRVIYFRYDDNNKVLMDVVYKTIVGMEGDIPVYAIKDDGSEYTTGLSTNMKVFPKLLQLYMSYKNMRG